MGVPLAPRVAILTRVVKVGLTKKGYLNKDLKEVQEVATWLSGGTASAKAMAHGRNSKEASEAKAEREQKS